MNTEPLSAQVRREPAQQAFPEGLPLARPRVADPARVAADTEATAARRRAATRRPIRRTKSGQRITPLREPTTKPRPNPRNPSRSTSSLTRSWRPPRNCLPRNWPRVS